MICQNDIFELSEYQKKYLAQIVENNFVFFLIVEMEKKKKQNRPLDNNRAYISKSI